MARPSKDINHIKLPHHPRSLVITAVSRTSMTKTLCILEKVFFFPELKCLWSFFFYLRYCISSSSSSSSSCSWRINRVSCSLILKMKLVPPSLPRSSYVFCPLGLYCNTCFGILFMSILCMCCSYFSWYCFISFTIFCAPVFPLIHWFLSLSSFAIPSKCLEYIYIYIYLFIYGTAWLCLSETACKRRVLTSSIASPYYRVILLPPGRMRVRNRNTNFAMGKEVQ